MSDPLSEIKEKKKKLVFKKNQEFVAPTKTESQKKIEFDLGAEVVNPLLNQEQQQKDQDKQKEPKETKEPTTNAEPKKTSLKDRIKLKKQSEAFKPEEHKKKEPDTQFNKTVPNFNSYKQYPPQPPYIPVPQQMLNQAVMNNMQPPYLMPQQGYYPSYGNYQPSYYHMPMYQSNKNIGNVPNYQTESHINLKESLNTKATHQSNQYVSNVSKHTQSERTVVVDEYTLKQPEPVNEKKQEIQDISITEPTDEEKKYDLQQTLNTAVNKDNPLVNKLIEKTNLTEDKSNKIEEPDKKEFQQKINEKETEPVQQKVETKTKVDENTDIQKAEPKAPATIEEKKAEQPGFYSHDFLDKYINDYSGGLPEEFQHLDRKIREVEAQPKKPKDSHKHKGRRYERMEASKPSQKHYGDYKSKEQKPVEKEGAKPEMLQRQHVSDETLIQIKKIKQGADHWLAGKKDDDVTIVNFKKIKALLNKLTADNFSRISKEIIALAENKDIITKLVEFLVVKAWNEPRYTKIYAELCYVLVEHKFDWDTKGKTIKREVLTKVENAYTQGFKNYYDLTKEIHLDENMTETEKREQIFKQKIMLIGNINFICELFHFKLLSFKVFKLIILYGIASFIKEYIRAELSQDKFTIKEDYLEALIKLFENSGKLIDKKEKAEEKKILEKKEKYITKTEDRILDMFYHMLENKEDLTDKFMEKTELDNYAKILNTVSYIFFDLVSHLKEMNISVRLQSLITNLEEFRDSNWTEEVHKIGAAKKKEDVQREIEKEKFAKDRYDYDDDDYGKYHSRRGGKESYVSSGRGYRKTTKGKGGDGYFEKKAAKSKSIPDLCKELISYFKENRNSLNEETFIEFLDNISGKKYKDALAAFFITFAKNPQETINIIIHYPYLLLKDDYITPAEFEKASAIANHELYLEFMDLPFLAPSMATILYDCIIDGLIILKNFAWSCPMEIQNDEFDASEYAYYCSEILKAVEKKFKAEGKEDLIAEHIPAIKSKLDQ